MVTGCNWKLWKLLACDASLANVYRGQWQFGEMSGKAR